MSKRILFGLGAALILISLPSFAQDTKSPRHTVVGLLSFNKDEPAKLIINPTNRARFTLQVKNKDWVAQLIRKVEYLGLVRVELQVSEQKLVRVLKIEPVRVRRVPLYDADFKAVANGNG